MDKGRWRAFAAAALALAVIVTAWIARASEGRRALAECDGALFRKDVVEAIVLARAAAEARCPFCSAPDLGYARLYSIAKDAETRGDDVTAIAAWRAVRAAALGTTVFDTASARRERADVEIARLGHRIDAAAAAAGNMASPAASEERLRAAQAAHAVPNGATFALLAIGGVLFLVSAVRFAAARGVRTADLAGAIAGAVVAACGVLLF
jgi:hypothetical protein